MSEKQLSIYKYCFGENFPLDKQILISIPLPHKILSVQFQGERLCVWVMTDPNGEKMTRCFRVVGSGWPLVLDDMKYLKHLATLQKDGFVWHVFVEES